MKHNIRKYVTHFKLVKTGEDTYSNVGGKDVLKVENNAIQIRGTDGIWRVTRQGDLIMSIIDNVPLHS